MNIGTKRILRETIESLSYIFVVNSVGLSVCLHSNFRSRLRKMQRFVQRVVDTNIQFGMVNITVVDLIEL